MMPNASTIMQVLPLSPALAFIKLEFVAPTRRVTPHCILRQYLKYHKFEHLNIIRGLSRGVRGSVPSIYQFLGGQPQMYVLSKIYVDRQNQISNEKQ